MVTVAIIGTLATIVTLSFNRQLIETRDSARATNATLFAAALEKYYDNKGEYPSPRALVSTYSGNTGDAVSTLLSIKDKSTLVMPNATSSTTNSIAAALGATDVMAYVASSASGSTSCQTDIAGGCDEFTLTYKKETDNSVVTIESAHKGRTAGYQTPLESPNQPTITAVQSGANVIATSSAPVCPTAGMTAMYSFQMKVAAGAWSAWTAWQTGSTYTNSSNTNATLYSFQVMVRCDLATGTGDSSPVGGPATVTYYTMPTTPTTPTITAQLSATYAQGLTGTVACNYGTAQYRIDWRTNDGAWSTGAWGTGLVANITATDGTKYGFRSTARCVNNTQIATSATSAEDTYIDPIATPAAPTVSGATYSAKTWTWTGSACPAGTSVSYEYVFRIYTGVWTSGSWVNVGTATSATNSAATSQGLAYDIYVHQRCGNAYTTSSWSTADNGAYFYVPVVHVQPQYWSGRIDTGGYPRIRLRTYTGVCATGLARETWVRISWSNAGYVDATSSWLAATDGFEFQSGARNILPGEFIEFSPLVRCRNTSTNYTTDATPVSSVKNLYDIGNIWSRGGAIYQTTCPTQAGQSSYCAGGYNSSGTKNTTNTTTLGCNIKPTGITDSTISNSAQYSFGTSNLCW